MSWMKRAQGGAPPAAGPERQPYAPPATQAQAQPYANQQNMYPNYQGGTTATGNAPQQQFWPMPAQQQPPQPQFNQQYGQVYQQPDYGANANQFYHQPTQFNQNYTNQGFSNPQQGYQQNYYPNQGVQQQNPTQNPMQNKTNPDAWEDNWDWGWEDSSKQKGAPPNIAPQQPPDAQPQQVFNNANVLEESFALTNTWNWSMEEKKDVREPPSATLQGNPEPVQVKVAHTLVENHTTSEQSTQKTVSNLSQHPADEVRTLNDRDVVKERLPNLAIGKRFHLDNLTPQWSIESQMSQESSDGPLTHSEGTYRSDNQSRNSNKSSPGLNTDNSNFNYSQSGLEEAYPQNTEWSRQSDDLTTVDSIQNGSRRESHDELSHSIQELSLGNHENNMQQQNNFVQENISATLSPPSVSSASFPISVSSNVTPQSLSSLSASSMVTPPPPASMPAPPITPVSLPPPPVASVSLPPPTSSVATLPPSNYPPMSSQNPFKHAGTFSHKTVAKAPNLAASQPFPPQMSNSTLTSPAVVNKVSQHRPVGFEANLETTPDNSERPDQPQMSAFRPMAVSQPVPDNMEVAPKNDRNEYLQTAHLSSGDYGENTDFSRNVPPPGFRRMVLGQQESEYSQNLNISGDEPPPGLARMVPGQQTETENNYNQPTDNYMDRHVDGQHTDSSGHPYRQADGQQTPDTNYNQPSQSRGSERRPIGLHRMVPGEPSNDDFHQYPGSTYGGTNEQRVVMGVDHDYPNPAEAGPADVREQNVDGSDYTEQTPRNPSRNIIGARESSSNVSPDFGAVPDDQQREITMEGENLQDLSIISSVDVAFSREQMLDGADETITDVGADRKTDVSDSTEHPVSSSRRQSLNRTITSGEESDRDRTFKNSPRRDRDKHKSSKNRDRERERNREMDRERERDKEGRYSRGDRKFDREGDRRAGRDDRRSEKERRDKDRERRDRDVSPDTRRTRRSTRSHRYETEDTDFSDRERDRRRYREGSYTSSKPPRPDDKDRRYGDERDRSRRYNTIERERRHDDERDVASRSNRRGEQRDKYERKYRDINPNRKYGNLRREREEEEHRRGETYSPCRPESRDATATDEDMNESRRRSDRRHRHPRPDRDPYYDGYGVSAGAGMAAGAGAGVGVGVGIYGDPYLAQRQQQQYQYQYYEHLRLTNPQAYMEVYKQVVAGHPAPPPPADYRPHLHHTKLTQLYGEVPGYTSLGYDGRTEERGASVHSGRSSTTGLKGNDTDLNTDASLNLHLEESTVRSERMTPYRFSTAHIKGSIGSQHVVVVRPSYPVDGLPATVHVLSLRAALAHDPHSADLRAYPGPLVKGITHKKSVIDYCVAQMRVASRGVAQSGVTQSGVTQSGVTQSGAHAHVDAVGCVLVWDLLALMLTQNGVVVGSDIAELLMKNTREYEYKQTSAKTHTHNESRRESSVSGEIQHVEQERTSSPDQPSISTSDITRQESPSSPGQSAVDEKAALDRLRDLLIYGNRQEAIEFAMCHKLWGHALQLAAHSSRRARALVAARFLAALARTDPLHTLYAALAAATPPAATCVSEERWGDWRPHAAIILSNSSARPDQDRQTLVQLGDSLSSRGLIYSAQFCYLSAGVPFSRHPLAPLGGAAVGTAGAAPPRLALLLADPRAPSLPLLATNQAIFATEIYEYALSLNQDYVIDELPVYKLLLATRLVDCGQYERALGYTEQAARALTRNPQLYSPQLVASLATLADRLKYHDPALQEEPPLLEESPGGESGEPSPRHHQQWLDDVKNVAHMLQQQTEGGSGVSAHATPQHYQHDHQHQHQHDHQQYQWDGQAQQQQQQQQYQQPPPPPSQPQLYPEPLNDTTEYVQQYKQMEGSEQQEVQRPYEDYGEQWQPTHTQEDHHTTYADPYWQNDRNYNYGEAGAGAAGAPAEGALEEPRPNITMPGATSAAMPLYGDYDDDRPPSADQKDRDTDSPKQSSKKSDSKSKENQMTDGKKSGWLGGFLTKLSLRPPNQMILPDDKNPSIVWDAEHKRWRNTDADGDEPALAPPPPPPKTAHLPHATTDPGSGSPPLQTAPGTGAAPLPPGAAPRSNLFKMQKGRHIKKSYVDVFNPSGAATRPLPPAAEVLGAPAATLQAPTNYFIPAPAPATLPAQSGIYDPSRVDEDPDVPYRSGI